MKHWEQAGASYRKQCHRFREAIYRVTPRLPQKQKNCGNQSAGVADSNPPHEVDNGEAPPHRDIHAPNAYAPHEQIADDVQHHHRDQERDAKTEEPSHRRRTRQHDRADLADDRSEGMPRLDHGGSLAADCHFFRSVVHGLTALRWRFQLEITIADLRQIGGPRPCVELIQQSVVAGVRLQFRHAAIRIIDVAEDNGVGRTGLLARRLQFAVLNFPVGPLGVDAMLIDALDTVSTFLHDAPTAHRHIWVAHHLVLRRIPVLEEQEVEAAYFVRAVVGTVARAHAAVVNHVIQAFGAVHGSADWTDYLARRVLALHAGHRLEKRSRIVTIALVVGIHSQPVHVPASDNLLFADHRDVILRLAGDDAVVAPDTGVHVDRHTPRVWLIFVIEARKQTQLGNRFLFRRKARVLLVFLQRSLTHQR